MEKRKNKSSDEYKIDVLEILAKNDGLSKNKVKAKAGCADPTMNSVLSFLIKIKAVEKEIKVRGMGYEHSYHLLPFGVQMLENVGITLDKSIKKQTEKRVAGYKDELFVFPLEDVIQMRDFVYGVELDETINFNRLRFAQLVERYMENRGNEKMQWAALGQIYQKLKPVYSNFSENEKFNDIWDKLKDIFDDK